MRARRIEWILEDTTLGQITADKLQFEADVVSIPAGAAGEDCVPDRA